MSRNASKMISFPYSESQQNWFGGEGVQERLRMFWTSRLHTFELVKPVAQPVAQQEEVSAVPKSYEQVAAIIGYAPVELIQRKFELLLLRFNQPIFNFQQVTEYLDAVKPKKTKVLWMPLTLADWEAASNILRCSCDADRHNHINTRLVKKPYDRLIPEIVLNRIVRLRQQISVNEAPFFVSDFAAVRPDPFLMTFFGDHFIVFDAWDEPGFGVA